MWLSIPQHKVAISEGLRKIGPTNASQKTTNSNPPYSPDLAPSDYLLFLKFKEHLAGTRFSNDDEAKDEIQRFLKEYGDVGKILVTLMMDMGGGGGGGGRRRRGGGGGRGGRGGGTWKRKTK
ncbi:Hypothetical predicted protein [Octopus vulgaris]|uniref:Histone-lysine N-methyltransferase SETMAR-like n=1 Tax=Octopus vulgaris TaxID=6645 RepID=A0AA36B3J1_OCTVU|nr:Hypothetical predicted protein [Octopus vulgaris]